MDTTVILAQPRVSRLRAAAGYVQNRGKSRQIAAPAGEFQIEHLHSGLSREPPLKSLQICPTDIPKMTQRVQKRVLSGNEIWAPKHAQSLYSERIHKEPYREM